MRRALLFRTLVSFVLLALSSLAYANQITPVAGQGIRYLPDHINAEDFLYVAPPNQAGISVNRFSQFAASEPLKLMNTPGYEAVTGSPLPSAKVVVIIAADIELSSVINIVGPATNLVLLTGQDEDGSITCVDCSFENTLKLSLLVAEPRLDENFEFTDQLGTFRSKGEIDIRSLYAPGAIGLDLLARFVGVDGVVSLNQSAMKSASGGYSAVSHGSYSMGSGDINLLSGAFEWNYENEKILKAVNSGISYRFSGILKAPRVSISTPNKLVFEGTVDTRTDAITAVSVDGTTHIPQEGITLQTLGNNSDVEVSGNLYTENTLDVRATRNVKLQPAAKINSAVVNVIAGADITNKDSIKSAMISMASENLFNEGRLEGSVKVDLWTDQLLANQYGGVIQGETIHLTSESGVVRNGSRTPYISTKANREGFLKLDNSPLLQAIKTGRDDMSIVDVTKEGAFYWVPNGVATSNAGSLTFAGNHKAHVIGDVIQILAPGIENINPYYEYLDLDNQRFESRQRLNDVAISAETKLSIAGGGSGDLLYPANYVVNSSSLITVNKSDSNLAIVTKEFVNGRYRSEIVFNKGAWNGQSLEQMFGYEGDQPPAIEIHSHDTFQASIAVFSPPGVVTSMGKTEATATSYFSNVFGYFESLGSVEIDAAVFKNFGLERQGYVEGSFSGRTCVLNNDGTVDPDCGTSFTAGYAQLKNAIALDSLFYVKNTLELNAVAWYETLNPFQYFTNRAAFVSSNMLDTPRGTSSTSGDTRGPYRQTGTKYRVNGGSIDASLNSFAIVDSVGSITVSYEYEHVFWDKKDNQMFEEDNYYTESVVQVTSSSETVSLIVILGRYYQAIKNKITELFDEFNWWGLAE